MPTKPRGRPQKPAPSLAERTPGMPRFTVELPADLVTKIDEEALHDDRSRIAEIRVLLGEAIAARRNGKAT